MPAKKTCSGKGLPDPDLAIKTVVSYTAISTLPYDSTLRSHSGRYVSVALSLPSLTTGRQPLAASLLCGARTFLPPHRRAIAMLLSEVQFSMKEVQRVVAGKVWSGRGRLVVLINPQEVGFYLFQIGVDLHS